jgi:hypothetical protein
MTNVIRKKRRMGHVMSSIHTPVTEDRVRIMIMESIEKYHKENLTRFDSLIEQLNEIIALVNKIKGVFFAVAVIGGLPAFVYYLIKIIQEIKK